MDGIIFQPLTRASADEAANVIRSAFAAQSRATRPPSSALRETVDSVAGKIEAGGGIGAFDRGKLVALALWLIDEDAFRIGRVSVLPSWRRRGLARALIAACGTEAKGRGLKRMSLRVRLELPENERLFERYGFERRGVDAHPGFDAPTQAMMEMDLG